MFFVTAPLIAFIGTAFEYVYFKLGPKAGGQVLCSSEAYLICFDDLPHLFMAEGPTKAGPTKRGLDGTLHLN